MAGEYSLSVIMSAQDKASSVIQGFLSNLGPIGGVVAGVGAVLAGVGIASVKMAGDFQSSMVGLVTGAGESQANLAMVSNGILNMAVATGTSTQQLSKGMFLVESAGYHGAAGLQVLQTAAEGAKVGNADLGTTANALTTILTDYHMSANQSAQAMNGLTATVSAGKTHLQDLASSMGAVLPIASKLHVSFPQVGGAMATMTNAGIPAQQAAQNIAHVLTALSAPSATAVKSMQSVGLSAQNVSNSLQNGGITGALQTIEDHIGKKFPAGSIQATTALKNIMGGITGLKLDTATGGASLATFKGNVDAITGAMNKGGSSVNGWAQVQGTFNFKMQQAQEAVETLMIKLGQGLLPAVTGLVSNITPLITGFANWLNNSNAIPNVMNGIGTALGIIGKVIGGVATGIGDMIHWFQQGSAPAQLVGAALGTIGTYLAAIKIGSFLAQIPGMLVSLGQWAAAAWASVPPLLAQAAAVLASTWPILAIIGAIALIILAVKNWGAISKWLQEAWSAFSSWFHGAMGAVGKFFSGVWDGIVTGLKAAWNAIVNVVKIGAMLLLAAAFAPFIAIGALFIWLYNHNTYFKALIDNIVKFVKIGVAWLLKAWQDVVGWIVGEWNLLVAQATVLWDSISIQIKIKFEQAIAFVKSVWEKISDFFVNAWNTYIAGPLTALWQNVSRIFSNAWNTYIAGPLNGIWNSVSKWFTDLGTHAEDSGKNFINMLVSGITSGAGAIWNAVTGIASNIWKALGFHSPPPAGPAADSDKWMPNMINMMSTGLMAGVPKIQAAVNVLAKPLAVMSMPAMQSIVPAVANTVTNVASGAPNLTGAPNISNSSSGMTMVNNITINSSARNAREQAEEILTYIDQKYRASGMMVNTPSGRRY